MHKKRLTTIHKKLNISSKDFKILINLKKNRRVCLNGEEVLIKAINTIHKTYRDISFYYCGLWNTNQGEEFEKVENTFHVLKNTIQYKDKIYNINGLDIRLLYELTRHMHFSIGNWGGGPREFSEWMQNLPTMVIDKHYGHPVTPFICYKKFCKTFGMDKCVLGPENLMNTDLDPTFQKKTVTIIDLPDFTLTEQEIDDRIKLMMNCIEKLKK